MDWKKFWHFKEGIRAWEVLGDILNFKASLKPLKVELSLYYWYLQLLISMFIFNAPILRDIFLGDSNLEQYCYLY